MIIQLMGGVMHEVESLKCASDVVRTLTIGMSSSEWYDRSGVGDVTENGKKIAHVSYNGRVWPPGKWTPETKEIEV